MRTLSLLSRTFSFGALLLSSLGGCGGNTDTSSTGGTGGTGGSTANADDVTGTVIDVYDTPSGKTEKPADPANVKIEALVPNGSGGFDARPAEYSADGTFVIKSVPQGEYFLHVGARYYLATSARTHDLGHRFTSRADAVPATKPTPMVFDVTQMQAWTDGDSLEVFSQGAGTWGDVIDGIAPEAYPTSGQTSLQGFSVDTSLLVLHDLVDGGKGDKLFLTHVAARADGAVPYTALSRYYQPAPFTQIDGKSQDLAGQFVPAPEKQATLDIRRTEYAALASAVHPTAMPADFLLFAYAEPGGKVDASSDGPPSIFTYSDSDLSDTPVSVAYGNPFPAEWGVETYFAIFFTASFTPPGQSDPRAVTATIGFTDEIGALQGKPLTPLLSPPKNLQIGGKDATGVLTGVGANPEVTWSAPDTGAPAIYRVTVRRLNSMPPAETIANLYTEQTHLVIPTGILESGEAYYLRVSAETPYDTAHPYRFTTHDAYAEAVTAPFAP